MKINVLYCSRDLIIFTWRRLFLNDLFGLKFYGTVNNIAVMLSCLPNDGSRKGKIESVEQIRRVYFAN